MNKPNMKWNESTKTTEARKAFLKSSSMEIEKGTKSELKCIFFKYIKNFPT